MENGLTREVWLYFSPKGEFTLELSGEEEERVAVTLPHTLLQDIVCSRELRAQGPTCQCTMMPDNKQVVFDIQAAHPVSFTMPVNQITILVTNLSLPDEST